MQTTSHNVASDGSSRLRQSYEAVTTNSQLAPLQSPKSTLVNKQNSGPTSKKNMATNSKHVTLSPDSRSMPPKNKSELVQQVESG